MRQGRRDGQLFHAVQQGLLQGCSLSTTYTCAKATNDDFTRYMNKLSLCAALVELLLRTIVYIPNLQYRALQLWACSLRGSAHFYLSSSTANVPQMTPSPLAFHSPTPLLPHSDIPSPIFVCMSYPPLPPSPVSRRTILHLLSFTLATNLSHPPTHARQSTSSPPSPVYHPLPCPPALPTCHPVEICDFRVGTGRVVTPDAILTLRWTGRLADRYGWPIQKEDAEQVILQLGQGTLIQGFEIGMQGMREGGKRRLLIPAELGYLNDVKGPLPADFGNRRRLFATVLNARRFKSAGDLVIDVELKKVRLPR